jgi:phenylalanyl-tRNA synthetase beta chain
MKFSESWLRTLVNPAMDRQALSHSLTMAGLEVEAIEPVAPPFDRVVVGEVKTLVKHPQADRLNLLTVDVGQGEPLQIVCGASNVAVGLKAPCALVGAKLPGGLDIKAAKVRGIESYGMMCSEKELGLADASEGLMVLDADAQPGTDIRQYLDLDDHTFTLKLTPNRADCLSVHGVAREVSAITGTLRTPKGSDHFKETFATTRTAAIADPTACGRYLGRSLRLDRPNASTPAWMARRLVRSGLRPKSVVVDVTNYVLLELGQPLHAFDESRLKGNLCVRWSRSGETLTLLNEQSVTLDDQVLVIADDSGPVALAGVMGGQPTAVQAGTREVFLESAFFAPKAIAGRARRFALASDSAYRFERGVDFKGTRAALDRATHLLLDICGGEAGTVVESLGELPERAPVRVRPDRVRRVLGIELPDEAMVTLLERLELRPMPVAQGFEVLPPSHRFDLSIEADFLEEIARLHGYDQIPATPPEGSLALLPQPEGRREALDLALVLVHRGYQEIVTYSFVDAEDEAVLSAKPSSVKLLNPIASQLSVMRSTLAVGLVNTLRFNLNRKQERVRIFEIGRCFFGMAAGDEQKKFVGGLIYGTRDPEQWGFKATPADFFDLKGDVTLLLGEASWTCVSTNHPALHPGRSAKVLKDGEPIGWMGELHPRLLAHYDLPQAPLLFEVELEPLLNTTIPSYQETSRFQPVRRDLAVVVDESVPAQQVLDALNGSGARGVTSVTLFDLYRGASLGQGKKSLAFRIVIEDTERTLNDADIESAVNVLIAVLQSRFNAELR